MAGTEGGEAATTEPAAGAEPEVAERDFEGEAREQGWRPKDEWTGKPGSWKTAQAFVEYGEIEASVEKRLDKKYATRFTNIERMNDKTRKAIESQHAKDIADLKAAQRAAVARQDTATYDAATRQLEEKIKDGPATAPDLDEGKLPPAEARWIKENPWYEEDDDLNAYAFALSQRLAKRFPANSFEENMKLVADKTRQAFPEKFGGAARTPNGHASVDGGGALNGAPARPADPLSRLPNEARAQAKKDMAAYPKVYPTADAWIKAYNS